MKKKILYTALFALMLASCSEQEFIEQPSTPAGGTEVQFPTDVTSGELLIKFDPAMTEILDQALKVATRSGGVMTRSGIPSTDEVLAIWVHTSLNVYFRSMLKMKNAPVVPDYICGIE